jgi:hypothetical protein
MILQLYNLFFTSLQKKYPLRLLIPKQGACLQGKVTTLFANLKIAKLLVVVAFLGSYITMHLDIIYIYVHSKIYVSRKSQND